MPRFDPSSPAGSASPILQYRSVPRRRKRYKSGIIVVLVILAPAILYYLFALGRVLRSLF